MIKVDNANNDEQQEYDNADSDTYQYRSYHASDCAATNDQGGAVADAEYNNDDDVYAYDYTDNHNRHLNHNIIHYNASQDHDDIT